MAPSSKAVETPGTRLVHAASRMTTRLSTRISFISTSRRLSTSTVACLRLQDIEGKYGTGRWRTRSPHAVLRTGSARPPGRCVPVGVECEVGPAGVGAEPPLLPLGLEVQGGVALDRPAAHRVGSQAADSSQEADRTEV